MSRLDHNHQKQHSRRLTTTSSIGTNTILGKLRRRHRHDSPIAVIVTITIVVMANQDTKCAVTIQ